MAFTLIHSSDWHLGKRLYHKSRENEFRKFLTWLGQELHSIDLLLIAGDIFDTNTPPLWAQELYYQFLHRAAQHCEVIVCAGNHDSALFLEAPKALLKTLRVHVIGKPSELLQAKVQDYGQTSETKQDLQSCSVDEPYPPELIPVYVDDQLQAVVSALPYLRDSYLRSSNWGETQEEKERQLQEGCANYYQVMCAESLRFLRQSGAEQAVEQVPIIAMGHLFASGSSTVENDGVRELYMGSLGHFATQLFPPHFDYIALGHIHQMQRLKSSRAEQEIRYSGAPLAFSFAEQKSRKQLLKVCFEARNKNITVIPVPQWQSLYQLKGTAPELEQGLQQLIRERETAESCKLDFDEESDSWIEPWLELEYTGEFAESQGLRERLHQLAETHGIEILRYRSTLSLGCFGAFAESATDQSGHTAEESISLRELSSEEVFGQLLRQQGFGGQVPAQMQTLGPKDTFEKRDEAAANAEANPEKAEAKLLTEQRLWQLYRSLLYEADVQKAQKSDSFPNESKKVRRQRNTESNAAIRNTDEGLGLDL